MSIWQHDEIVSKIFRGTRPSCPHCPESPLWTSDATRELSPHISGFACDEDGNEIETSLDSAELLGCNLCGYWEIEVRAAEDHYRPWMWTQGLASRAAAGALRVFGSTPTTVDRIERIRQEIVARENKDRLLGLAPRDLERIITRVYEDLGLKPLHTGRTGDGGIDIVLHGEQQIAVQVKRYKDRIGVAQIREFLGALLLEGYTRGLFVTTSDFTSGARNAVLKAQQEQMYIELNDGDQLLVDLEVAQYESFQRDDVINCIARYSENIWDSKHSLDRW